MEEAVKNEFNEAAPTRSSVARHGHLKGGDGRYYRVVRMGMNDLGARLESLIEDFKLRSQEEGTTSSEIREVVRDLFIASMSPFYHETEISQWLDQGLFSFMDLVQLVRIVSGDDALEGIEKKSSPGVS